MNLSKKIVFGVAVSFFAQGVFAQTLEQGIAKIDSHKYAEAKTNFEQMISSKPSSENYFYLGNTFLSQNEPDFTKAEENFRKGLEKESKSYLNRLGLASIRLGKGDKSAISEIQNIVKESRERDAEVLFRAAEALTLFEKNSNADLAVQYLDKAIEKLINKGVPAHYYYTLGDAYRLKLSNSPQIAGSAMTAYDKALSVATNKASVYTRMATLWMQAQQWQRAKEQITKAISIDPSYAPAYKALANYEIRFQQGASATKALENYAKYADEDPVTQLEISKLYFTNQNYEKSKSTLDKIFGQIQDPIKYKLRAYLLYADKKYAEAQQDLNQFLTTVEDKSRIYPADRGLEGLIIAGLSKSEKDEQTKANMLKDAEQKIAIAKNAKDETLDWDTELINMKGGGIDIQAVNSGPTNSVIEGLKKQIELNSKDVDAIVKLGAAYQEVGNWNGAIMTWDKMIALSPTWSYSYYAKGAAYQQLSNPEMSEVFYQRFVDIVSSQKQEEQVAQKEALSYAYYVLAFYNQSKNLEKSKEYVKKSLEFNPSYKDASDLNDQLNSK